MKLKDKEDSDVDDGVPYRSKSKIYGLGLDHQLGRMGERMIDTNDEDNVLSLSRKESIAGCRIAGQRVSEGRRYKYNWLKISIKSTNLALQSLDGHKMDLLGKILEGRDKGDEVKRGLIEKIKEKFGGMG